MFQSERTKRNSQCNLKREPVLAGSLFVVTACASGGYYEFVNAILAVLAICFLLISAGKNNREVRLENYLVFPLLLLASYAIVSFYAVDSGMAWTGAVKKSVPFLFACLLWNMKPEQRRKMMEKLPICACGVTCVGGIGILLPTVRPYIWMAGRFAGTFGYANTYALFLLIALLILMECARDMKRLTVIVEASILLLALWLTGSRYTWLLAIAVLIYTVLRYGKNRKWYGILLGLFLLATAGAATLFRNTEAIGRLFTTNRSTLFGRFLYWQDALQLICKHPFGMGYLGYYYKQTAIQTGVYTVRYVHNDWLQWVLDLGWIPAILLILCLLRALLNRRRPYLERLLLGVILIHGCMEFDLEHSVILMLVILILSCSEENLFIKHVFTVKTLWEKALLIAAGGISLYFAVPLTLYAMGDTQGAAACYPVYTEAQISNLSQEEDPEKARLMADKILKQNDTVALAYDAKATVAYLENDWDAMFRYKKEAIRRNKYDVDEYTQALLLLQAMEEETGESQLVQQRSQEIKDLAKTNEASVSALGKLIDDQVNLELSD